MKNISFREFVEKYIVVKSNDNVYKIQQSSVKNIMLNVSVCSRKTHTTIEFVHKLRALLHDNACINIACKNDNDWLKILKLYEYVFSEKLYFKKTKDQMYFVSMQPIIHT